MSRDIARAWNILYSVAIENLDKKQRDNLDSEIFRRPVGETRMLGDSYDLALAKGAAAYAKSLARNVPAIESGEVKTEGG